MMKVSWLLARVACCWLLSLALALALALRGLGWHD